MTSFNVLPEQRIPIFRNSFSPGHSIYRQSVPVRFSYGAPAGRQSIGGGQQEWRQRYNETAPNQRYSQRRRIFSHEREEEGRERHVTPFDTSFHRQTYQLGRSKKKYKIFEQYPLGVGHSFKDNHKPQLSRSYEVIKIEPYNSPPKQNIILRHQLMQTLGFDKVERSELKRQRAPSHIMTPE
jgi:hypothetical protein